MQTFKQLGLIKNSESTSSVCYIAVLDHKLLQQNEDE